MEASPIGTARLRRLSGGMGMLDMQFGYSLPQVEAMFAKIGAEGRTLYAGLLGLDFVFAAAYTVLQALLISALLRKAGLGGRWARLNLIPFALGAKTTIRPALSEAKA